MDSAPPPLRGRDRARWVRALGADSPAELRHGLLEGLHHDGIPVLHAGRVLIVKPPGAGLRVLHEVFEHGDGHLHVLQASTAEFVLEDRVHELLEPGREDSRGGLIGAHVVVPGGQDLHRLPLDGLQLVHVDLKRVQQVGQELPGRYGEDIVLDGLHVIGRELATTGHQALKELPDAPGPVVIGPGPAYLIHERVIGRARWPVVGRYYVAPGRVHQVRHLIWRVDPVVLVPLALASAPVVGQPYPERVQAI